MNYKVNYLIAAALTICSLSGFGHTIQGGSEGFEPETKYADAGENPDEAAFLFNQMIDLVSAPDNMDYATSVKNNLDRMINSNPEQIYNNQKFLKTLLFASLVAPETFGKYLDENVREFLVDKEISSLLTLGLSEAYLINQLKTNTHPCTRCVKYDDLMVDIQNMMNTHPDHQIELQFLAMHLSMVFNQWGNANQYASQILKTETNTPLKVAIRENIKNTQTQMMTLKIN